MTAVGFALFVLAIVIESITGNKLYSFSIVISLLGVVLVCGGIFVWLWRYMP